MRFHRQRLLTSKRKQLLSEHRPTLNGALNAVQHFKRITMINMSCDYIHPAGHHAQNIVEIVRDATCQLTERLHFLGLEERSIGQIQRLRRFPLLGNVASNFSKPDQLALVVANGINNGVCPECRAVFANTQPFLFEPSLLYRGGQSQLRQTASPIFRRVKLGKVLTDNLGARVAFHALRADVPVGNLARGRDHENCVVRDALHQEAETLLAFAQRFLRCSPLGDIACDLGETNEVAGIVSNRVYDNTCPKTSPIFADPTPLVLEFSFIQRRLQRSGRNTRRLVLRRIKAGKVLTNDLMGSVALEALCTGIPATHVAFRSQHVNSVVAHTGYKKLEALLIRYGIGQIAAGLHDLSRNRLPKSTGQPTWLTFLNNIISSRGQALRH